MRRPLLALLCLCLCGRPVSAEPSPHAGAGPGREASSGSGSGAAAASAAVQAGGSTKASPAAPATSVPGQPAAVPVPSSPQFPRVRDGRTLVRLEAYVTRDGVPVTGLPASAFTVSEDDEEQTLEEVRPVGARAEAGASPRRFVVWLDRWHLAATTDVAAVAQLIDAVVASSDQVAVMTPDTRPADLVFSARGPGLRQTLTDAMAWAPGDRDVAGLDLERRCFADGRGGAAIADELTARRREQETIRAFNAALSQLEDVREGRTFVLLVSDGWAMFKANDRVEDATLSDECQRERTRLAYIDHEFETRMTTQRANRATVSIYPVRPDALSTAADAGSPATGVAERRRESLRTLGQLTDATALVTPADRDAWLQRVRNDTGASYVLSYYAHNTKFDGRFRRVTVDVAAEGVDVRTRLGYLALTETEARAIGAVTTQVLGPGGRALPPPAVTRALDRLGPSSSRALSPLRVQVVGFTSTVRTVVELEPTAARLPEWQAGMAVQVLIESEKGGSPVVLQGEMRPSQRVLTLDGPDADAALAPGRYIVRVEGRPLRTTSGSGAVRASGDVVLGAPATRFGSGMQLLRRSPSTGLAYVPTADPRYRRTDRLRLEVPVLGAGEAAVTARVLTREGDPLPLVVTISERTDADTGVRWAVGDVTLAPLAQGEYVVEFKLGSEVTAYGLRIIP